MMTPLLEKNVREVNPVKLVWLITLLSFSVGVFMVYLVWSTLTGFRTERENLFELRERINSIQAELESSIAKQKAEVADLLEAKTDDSTSAENFYILNLIRNYRQTASGHGLGESFDQLEKNINSFFSVKDKLTWWASAYMRTVPRIPAAGKEVEDVLNQIYETVDQAEGQLRIQRAATIRELRQNPEKITISDINLIAASNVFSIIRRDVTDLLQISDRLHIITESDNLADLKDNKIRTILARLRLNTKLARNEKSTEKTKLNSLLDDYEKALFGQGYSIDNDHQFVILGYDGEYGLIQDQLKMVEERDKLREEVFGIYEIIDASMARISSETENIARHEVSKVENTLGQTWRTMMIIWLVTSIIYAMLAYEMISAANQQIKAIEDSNTDLEAMAKELKESEERLHRLSQDLFTVQENERRRISLELHDELGQSMAALKLQLGAAARRLTATPANRELITACEEMRDNINQIIENVRRLARDLSPVVLDDLGLQAAIEYLVNNFSKIYNVDIRYRYTDINHLFNQDAQRLIYRILQEALTNIAKHAKAKNVAITIEELDQEVRFEVRDNGKGFNVQKTLDMKGTDRGMGLEAMAERVRILGGKINIVSRPGIDTTISFTAPIK